MEDAGRIKERKGKEANKRKVGGEERRPIGCSDGRMEPSRGPTG